MEYDVCVIGLGYIGIPTATIFANIGKKVLGVDVVEQKVNMVAQGRSSIGEHEIDEMLKTVVSRGLLSTAMVPASSKAYIIAVPTPFKKTKEGRKIPDMSYVESATRSIAKCIQSNQLVILESTSPVGTTGNMRVWLKDELSKIGRDSDVDFEKILFAHAPERILPGQMLKELVTNDRIVGGTTPEASNVAQKLYKEFCAGEVIITDARTAEMTKLTENASRDVSIAFANELSIVCDKLGIDVWELIRLANRHPRVKILNPGPGVGGHCIAVDPWFIIAAAEKETPLMRTAREVNDHKPFWVISKIEDIASNLGNPKPIVACLGITFKADVNDLRESPALEIAERLANSNKYEVLIVEPHIESLPRSLSKAKLVALEVAVKTSDIIALLVDHKQFLTLDKKLLKNKSLIDTKGVV